ncbi:hypothetical protein AZE42_09131 [Rhizopogon vesiculosus]|uniref:Uncharacterized protein n=1 Tax=Rhizopogon vesiculosus TaxID=180088 RepID=A0A1J8R5J7_9AGAM|nr:hypothetical protein AZE42_09131 [Rhizopogon vesiculosus]
MELQQSQKSSISSHPGPCAVEFATVRDKQALFVARRPEKTRDKTPTIVNRVDTFHLFIEFTCTVNLVVDDYPTNDPFTHILWSSSVSLLATALHTVWDLLISTSTFSFSLSA